MRKNLDDFNALSEEDKAFIKKDGVIIRSKGETSIECITEFKPYWHIHAACGEFDDVQSRDSFLKRLLEFADYKAFKQ